MTAETVNGVMRISPRSASVLGGKSDTPDESRPQIFGCLQCIFAFYKKHNSNVKDYDFTVLLLLLLLNGRTVRQQSDLRKQIYEARYTDHKKQSIKSMDHYQI